MKCSYCRKPISTRDQKRAVIRTDSEGRIIAAYHHAHARTARATERTGGALPGKQYRSDSPGAYDVDKVTKEDVEDEALRGHQEDLERARQDEEVPKAWDDWRDPQTVTLEDLT